ncbi:hypothetical protein JVW19_24160, partial [Vibrio cholerae O1]|nr:hypothetical protein [Vibrio cholerae O1]
IFLAGKVFQLFQETCDLLLTLTHQVYNFFFDDRTTHVMVSILTIRFNHFMQILIFQQGLQTHLNGVQRLQRHR